MSPRPRTRPAQAVIAVFLSSLSGAPLHAEAPAPAPATVATTPPVRGEGRGRRPTVDGWLDACLAHNPGSPGSGDNFFPGTGSSARRDGAGLNLAAIELRLDPEPLGFQLVLAVGKSTDVVHGVEFGGLGVDLDDYRLVQTAKLSWKASSRLILDAGIMPAHVGYEVFPSKDNWNYTRSWMAELSPYYQTGLAARFTLGNGFGAQLLVLTGWQLVEDNNDRPTLGTQLAWSDERSSLSWNTLRGPELTGDERSLRRFDDFVATWRASRRLQLAATYDVGSQEFPGIPEAEWHAVAGYARWQLDRKVAVALRAERFSDPENGISGVAQTLRERTFTLEYVPRSDLTLKLDLRRDESDAAVFRAGPGRVATQDLVVLGLVMRF